MNELKNDILFISKEAKERKLIDKEVIDGTIGVLYSEQEELLVYNVIKKQLRKLNDEQTFDYSQIDGGEEYIKLVNQYLFGDYLKDISLHFNIFTIATPGSSGALHLALKDTKEKEIISPNIYWANYNMIFKHTKHTFKCFEMFDKDKFNLKGLEKLLDKNTLNTIIINDPCHNPTGYSLSYSEWKTLFVLSNEYPINYIIDLAYLDYGGANYNKTRRFFELFDYIDEKSSIYLCFSGSKSFCCYGLRIGALIKLDRIKKDNKEFNELARSTWSNCCTAGISLFKNIVGIEKNFNEYKKELKKTINILSLKYQLFIKESNECGLEIFPGKNGFYVLIKSKDVNQDLLNLKNVNIFLTPANNHLRLTIALINLEHIKGLALKIKEVLSA
jgi:aspartate/tyrosine/aromatic aminotransferase